MIRKNFDVAIIEAPMKIGQVIVSNILGQDVDLWRLEG